VTTALAISTLLLWLAVVVLAALVFALMRQIGVLHERIAPAGALVGREGPQPGEAAPQLEVADWQGAPLRLGGVAEDARATLLFFVSPTCPVCKTLLPYVAGICRAEDPSTRLVIASDGPRAEHEAFVRDFALHRGHYVLSAPLAQAYQVGRLPYAILVDPAGTVAARGLVNTREHLESLFEARRRGVASVQDHAKRVA